MTTLLVDRPAPQVARLLINRPEKRNAIDHDVRQRLIEALTRLLGDGETRALVFGGSDGHFSAGGDLPSMVGLSEVQARSRMSHVATLCRLVASASVPVVTAMEGICVGACVGLALLGDYIVVGNNTQILLPFLKLGLVPDWGSLRSLPRRVGLPTTRRLLTCGERLSGAEAQRLGLADELVVDADVMQIAVHRAAELSALPQAAFARMKKRLNQPSSTMEEELQRETDDQSELLRGEDFREGYAAFVEKRPANFIRPVDGKL
jgi:enoyl-CoA hydratase/carnithine racemase